MSQRAEAQKYARCSGCPATLHSCKILTRDRGRPCCPICNHRPPEPETETTPAPARTTRKRRR